MDYRVRALNARRQSMHAHHQNGLSTTKAVEAHTTAIMTRYLVERSTDL
jgi:hypothetical protein